MKKIFALAFVFSSAAIIAQTSNDDYYGSPAKPKLISADRVSTSLSAGTGIGFSNATKNTSFTTYIAPKVNYQLSDKFKIGVGFMHYTSTANTLFLMNNNEGIANPSNKSISGNLVSIGGSYQLNKKLILSGNYMMDVNSLSGNRNGYKAATIGMDYKTSEHTSIGFRATISQGNKNYFNNNAMFPPAGFNDGFSNGFSNNSNMFIR